METNNSQGQTSLSLVQAERLSRGEQCPVCRGDNHCRIAKGHLYTGPCWCEEINVSCQTLRTLAADHFEPACLCQSCLRTVAQPTHQEEEPPEVRKTPVLPESSHLASNEEDYYHDQNGNLVFTADYHLRRGTCCGNGCRHCPF